MYVKDVKDWKRTYTYIFVRVCGMLKMSEMSFSFSLIVMLSMSKIDQIHLSAVMLCMSKMSKMGKEHTHTFLLITSLIFNGFSIQKKFWKAETSSMCVEECQRC